MTDQGPTILTAEQLSSLESSLHLGSAEATRALVKWIGRPSVIEIDTLEQLPLEEATSVLSANEEPFCFCTTEIRGSLTGEMIVAFSDASGLAMAEILLGESRNDCREWNEMTSSAVLETTNILCCSYLNSLARSLTRADDAPELLPGPPKFTRDFAESLLEFALMGQAVASDYVMLAKTRFEIEATPVDWVLLFIPDSPSMSRLSDFLPVDGSPT